MATSAARIVKILAGRRRITGLRSLETCSPDPYTDFMCDAQGRRFTRRCQYGANCELTCTAWVETGSC